MAGEKQEVWIGSMRNELGSLEARDVNEDVTNEDLQRRYWSKGINVKIVLARLLPIKKPSMMEKEGGWRKQGS